MTNLSEQFFTITVTFDIKEKTKAKALAKVKKAVLRMEKELNKDIEVSSLCAE